jgi:hypothetical protein
MEPLEESYLKWLYGQVANPGLEDPDRTYWLLLGQLQSTKFVHLIANDQNRMMDGKALRREFAMSCGIQVSQDWLDLRCSMLELVFAMSRHMAFEDLHGGTAHYWFWRLLDNLGFMGFNDSELNGPDGADHKNHIDIVLKDVNFRVYNPSGRGGFFPLKHAQQDQRDVELWYQMGAYILEQ